MGSENEERALQIPQRKCYRHDHKPHELPSKTLAGRLFGSKVSKSLRPFSQSPLQRSNKSDGDVFFSCKQDQHYDEEQDQDNSSGALSNSLVGRLSAKWHVRKMLKRSNTADDSTDFTAAAHHQDTTTSTGTGRGRAASLLGSASNMNHIIVDEQDTASCSASFRHDNSKPSERTSTNTARPVTATLSAAPGSPNNNKSSNNMNTNKVKFQQEQAQQNTHKRTAHTSTSTGAGFAGCDYRLTDETRDQLLSKQPSDGVSTMNNSIKVPLLPLPLMTDQPQSSKQRLSQTTNVLNSSLAGRLRRRKETASARLQLERKASASDSTSLVGNISQQHQVTLLKRPLDAPEGRPILSQSLAGCLRTTRANPLNGSKHGSKKSNKASSRTKTRRRGSSDHNMISCVEQCYPSSSTSTNLDHSLVGRLKMIATRTRSQMDCKDNKTCKTSSLRDVLNATSSTCSNSLMGMGLQGIMVVHNHNNKPASGSKKHHPNSNANNTKALELAMEMREAVQNRLEDRRAGSLLHLHADTFLHSEALMWLVDRQVEFEEEKCRQEQHHAAGTAPVVGVGGVLGAAITTAHNKLPNDYSRYEDNLLEWKACHTGDMLKDAGYIVQLSGKDGFRAHRKVNCVFKFNNAAIARDLHKQEQAAAVAAGEEGDKDGVRSCVVYEHSKISRYNDDDDDDPEGGASDTSSNKDHYELRTSGVGGLFDASRNQVTPPPQPAQSPARLSNLTNSRQHSHSARVLMVDEQERAVLKSRHDHAPCISSGAGGRIAMPLYGSASAALPSPRTMTPSASAPQDHHPHRHHAEHQQEEPRIVDLTLTLLMREQKQERRQLELREQHSLARLSCLGGLLRPERLVLSSLQMSMGDDAYDSGQQALPLDPEMDDASEQSCYFTAASFQASSLGSRSSGSCSISSASNSRV
jgi:hypothetical protein